MVSAIRTVVFSVLSVYSILNSSSSFAVLPPCPVGIVAASKLKLVCSGVWSVHHGFNSYATSIAPSSAADLEGNNLVLARPKGGITCVAGKNEPVEFPSLETGYYPLYGSFLGSDLAVQGLHTQEGQSNLISFVNFRQSPLQVKPVTLPDYIVNILGGGRVDNDRFYVHSWYKDPGESANQTRTRLYLINFRTGQVEKTSGADGNGALASAVGKNGIYTFETRQVTRLSSDTLLGQKSFPAKIPRIVHSVLPLTDELFVLGDGDGAFGSWSEQVGYKSFPSLPTHGGRGVLTVPINRTTFLSFFNTGSANFPEKQIMIYDVANAAYWMLSDDGPGQLISVVVMKNAKVVALDNQGMIFVWNGNQPEPIRKFQLVESENGDAQKLEGKALFHYQGGLAVSVGSEIRILPELWK